MRAPGITYQFASPKDVAGPSFEILSRHLQISTGLVVVETLLTDLAKDRILCFNNAAVRADPGAAQNVIAIQIQGVTQTGENFVIASFDAALTADKIEDLNWAGSVYLLGGGPGTTTLRVFSSYNSGAAANTMTVGLHGIVIPRGNAGAF